MAKLNRDKHLKRFHELTAPLGGDIQGYALVAIDVNGEAFWGAQFSHNPRVQQALRRWLKVMLDDVQGLMKKAGQ
jgi:hypothetical protein